MAPDDYIKLLERRVHNQRARLRQLEDIHGYRAAARTHWRAPRWLYKCCELARELTRQQRGAQPTGFWEWLDLAYRDGSRGDDRKFTKWNMEVAYEAGFCAGSERTAPEAGTSDANISKNSGPTDS